MKSVKTIFAAALGMMALAVASCSPKANNAETTEPQSKDAALDSIMKIANDGQIVRLDQDSVLTSDLKVKNTTLILFTAEDSPICRKLETAVERLADEYNGSVAIITVDAAKCPATAADFDLGSSPLVPYLAVLSPDSGEIEGYAGLDSFRDQDADGTDKEADDIYASLLYYAGFSETK